MSCLVGAYTIIISIFQVFILESYQIYIFVYFEVEHNKNM